MGNYDSHNRLTLNSCTRYNNKCLIKSAGYVLLKCKY